MSKTGTRGRLLVLPAAEAKRRQEERLARIQESILKINRLMAGMKENVSSFPEEMPTSNAKKEEDSK